MNLKKTLFTGFIAASMVGNAQSFHVKIDKKQELAKELVKEESFCGIPVSKLTMSQKELFENLTPQEKKLFSRTIYIDTINGQINFLEAKIAIMDKDLAKGVTRAHADSILSVKGGGWVLPKETELITRSGFYGVDTKKSDFAKMMEQTPGENPIKKINNFILLTNVSRLSPETSWYCWTKPNSNKSRDHGVVRRVYERGTVHSSVHKDRYANVRPVKYLE